MIRMTGKELAIELLEALDISRMPNDGNEFAYRISEICKAAFVIASCINICGVISDDEKTDISDGAQADSR